MWTGQSVAGTWRVRRIMDRLCSCVSLLQTTIMLWRQHNATGEEVFVVFKCHCYASVMGCERGQCDWLQVRQEGLAPRACSAS